MKEEDRRTKKRVGGQKDERQTEKLSEVHFKRMGERIGEGQREWEKNKENRREGRGE